MRCKHPVASTHCQHGGGGPKVEASYAPRTRQHRVELKQGRGIPLPSQLRGLGVRHNASVQGRAPALMHCLPHRRLLTE